MAYRPVSFYGQGAMAPIQREYASDPRNQMFQQLMQQGVGNVQSPLEGLTKALTQGVGGYFAGKSAGEMKDRENAYSDAMMKALSGARPHENARPDPAFVGPMQGNPGGMQGVLDAGLATGNKDILPFLQQAQMQNIQQEQAAQQAEIARRQKLADAIRLKQTPGAPNSPTGRPAAPIQNFDRRQELVNQFGEGSPQVRQFDNYVRASQYANIGGSVIQQNPADPTNPVTVATTTLKPGEEPAVRKQQAAATAAGALEGKTATQAKIDYPQVEADATEIVDLLDKISNHPGLSGVVGIPSFSGAVGLPGTDEKDFKVLLDQVQGKQFMQAYQSLKGGGVITEIEGTKATDALARMNTAQTEKEFLAGVADFKKVVERGLIRAQERAKINAEGGQSGAQGASPVIKYDAQGNRIQ